MPTLYVGMVSGTLCLFFVVSACLDRSLTSFFFLFFVVSNSHRFLFFFSESRVWKDDCFDNKTIMIPLVSPLPSPTIDLTLSFTGNKRHVLSAASWKMNTSEQMKLPELCELNMIGTADCMNLIRSAGKVDDVYSFVYIPGTRGLLF